MVLSGIHKLADAHFHFCLILPVASLVSFSLFYGHLIACDLSDLWLVTWWFI